MNISFHGIKNAGADFEYRPEHRLVQYKNQKNGRASTLFIPRGKTFELHCELNNTGTNDLDEFRDILKAFPNRNGRRNVIDFVMDSSYKIVDMKYELKNDICVINGQKFDINHKNYPMFAKIYSLVEKITKRAENNELTYTKNYIGSKNCRDSYASFYNYYRNNPKMAEMTIEKFLDPKRIKETCLMLQSALLLALSDSRR